MIGIIDFCALCILTSIQISITFMSFESWGKSIHADSFAEDLSYLILSKQHPIRARIQTSTFDIEDLNFYPGFLITKYKGVPAPLFTIGGGIYSVFEITIVGGY